MGQNTEETRRRSSMFCEISEAMGFSSQYRNLTMTHLTDLKYPLLPVCCQEDVELHQLVGGQPQRRPHQGDVKQLEHPELQPGGEKAADTEMEMDCVISLT